MLGGLIKKLVGDSNERALQDVRGIAEAVEALDASYRALSDEALSARTAELRARLADGATLDDVLVEALATVREAIARAVGERAYPVQIMGAVVLHRGAIAEMRTGEGKTLVATMALYVNALAGDGTHLVTVNDYLARREPQWYGPALHLLGLSLGVLQHDTAYLYSAERVTDTASMEHLAPATRRQAYAADITYGTNNEFGFDYLRDNMAQSQEAKVQRGLHFAIVDESDSVLIDEARTPLIISGPLQEDLSLYPRFARVVPSLREGTDFTIDPRTRAVQLTESGVSAVERGIGVENLYAPENFQLTRHLEAALKAAFIYQRDHDYVVKDGQVVIVDDFTGRLMEGRRWSDGLHQAVEAKEGVQIQQESVTYATITLQNLFRMYEKLAGMTGTAATEAEELSEIYKLEVVVMPTHREMIRDDLADRVYRNGRAKFNAVIDDVEEKHATGRPVLVGTVSIESSELLSEMLSRRGIEHEVLNAKQHQREASIVARAGQRDAVTIATNMAGRGTDIKLGEGVAALGGLHIIGTERHESRRIDNQLRGRAGRQGDPGSTRFYVSFEDDLMRRFAPDWLPGMMERLGMEEGEAIESRMVTRAIEQAQSKVEAYHFDIRKHVVEYDDVMNTQRAVIYAERDKVLRGDQLRETVLGMLEEEIAGLAAQHLVQGPDFDPGLLRGTLETLVPLQPEDLPVETLHEQALDDVLDAVSEIIETRYAAIEAEAGEDRQRLVERFVLLRTIDTLWVQHLTAMDEMRQGIGLQAFAQGNPLVQYKREAHDMWEQLLDNIRSSVARQLMHARLVTVPTTPPPPRPMRETGPGEPDGDPAGVEGGGGTATATATAVAQKVGRNEPCPCGSGKKYKRCHGQ